MQVNLVQSNYQPDFRANVSDDFVKAAKNYLLKINNQPKLDYFTKKVANFKNYGTDDMGVIHQKFYLDGKQHHALYVTKKGMKPEEYILLTVKDQFRKVVEKFLHINKYEFDIKTNHIK